MKRPHLPTLATAVVVSLVLLAAYHLVTGRHSA